MSKPGPSVSKPANTTAGAAPAPEDQTEDAETPAESEAAVETTTTKEGTQGNSGSEEYDQENEEEKLEKMQKELSELNEKTK